MEYFEQMRQELIPHLSAKVKEKTGMYDRIQREAKQVLYVLLLEFVKCCIVYLYTLNYKLA